MNWFVSREAFIERGRALDRAESEIARLQQANADLVNALAANSRQVVPFRAASAPEEARRPPRRHLTIEQARAELEAKSQREAFGAEILKHASPTPGNPEGDA